MIVTPTNTWRDLRPLSPRERLDAWSLGTYRERRDAEREQRDAGREQRDAEREQQRKEAQA